MQNAQNLTNKQKLIVYLMDKGLSDEEIARILADVAESAFEQFTKEAMEKFTDEDKKAIESAPTELDVDMEIKKRFTLRTGEDAQAYLERLIEEHARSYMNEENGQNGNVSS